jgi:hypothetical protein
MLAEIVARAVQEKGSAAPAEGRPPVNGGRRRAPRLLHCPVYKWLPHAIVIVEIFGSGKAAKQSWLRSVVIEPQQAMFERLFARCAGSGKSGK